MHSPLRVLVVEDSEDDMLLVLRELRRGGYTLDAMRVETATEMKAALDASALNRQPWDLVIADYSLPAFSAPEALKLLQIHQQDLPFIIVSGTITEETAVAAMKAGAHDFITKSNLSRLVPAIERELREAEERQKRHAAEQALRESEERFRQLAENMVESVLWMSDPKAAQILYVSPAYEQIWGRPCESLYANYMEWLEAIHPEDRQHIQTKNFEQALAGRYEEEYRIIRPDGSVRWIRGRSFPIRDAAGEPYRLVGIAEDITERVRLRAERKQTDQKIREQAALLDITTDAIAVRDLENRILYWNQGAERLYGWTAAEAIGQNANQFLYRIPPSTLAEDTVLRTGEWQGELQQVTKTDQEVTVASRWTLVRDEASQPKSILVVNTNITEQKQLEAQFLRAQRLESIGTLAGGIAHDLNNLLTPILLTSQILQKKLSDSDHQELLKIQESNARRGADLVRQILTFARGADVKRLPLSLPPLLQEVVQMCDRTFPESISVSLDVVDDLQLVAGDATQLQQVLMNLCVNARDAMPTGGRLEVSAHNLEIDQAFASANLEAEEGAYVVITVSDTGEGIAPQLLERIFDPFFTTKPVGQGTGLGLSVVQGIISSQNGFIRVASQVGQGTEFKLYLPTIQISCPVEFVEFGSPDEHINLDEASLGSVSSGLILLVDDDLPLQQITQLVLEENNYRVLTATNGQEAISLYAHHQDEIALVLIDMAMPEMDGATAILKLQRLNPQVKIMASSGIPSMLLNLGVTACLPKPYSAQELLQRVDQLLNSEPGSSLEFLED